MRIENFLCDMCGEVLCGRKGTAEVKKRFLSINGQVLVDDWDDELERRTYFHVSPAKFATMIFCGIRCFEAYVEMREEIWKTKRMQLLREGKLAVGSGQM